MHLSGLFFYPVKSCRGVTLDAAGLDERGIRGDRRFLIVDDDDRFLTQRVLPRMAVIETALTASDLVLSAAGHGTIPVPLRPSPSAGAARTVVVWRDTVTAEDQGDLPAAWLSRVLDRPCRLVRIGAAYTRPIPDRKIPAALASGSARHQVSFADAFPFLLLSEASLADLNARLAQPVPMNRFRPSLVVSGCAAFAEDRWNRFRIGSAVFHRATPCARCIITTTDQLTAERHLHEPLRTLATYRRDPAEPANVNFGQNLIHETKTGHLRLGDPVELLG